MVGLLITLAAAATNALGLNVSKLDYNRQAVLPPNQRKPDWQRPFWILGLALYIASQVVGSTLALEFMRAEYVAPLGSTSLIFNLMFAYLLVGTPITRLDVAGTVTVILGVVGVVVFGNIRIKTDAIDAESNLSLSLLKELWGRSDWIIFLFFLEFTTVLFWWLSRIAHEVCMARVIDERGDADGDGSRYDAMVEGGGGRRVANPYEGEGFLGQLKSIRDAWHRKQGKVRSVLKRSLERWCASRPDSSIRQLAAFAWAVTAGLLSGQTLILAKSGVKLVTSALHKTDPNEANQFTSPLSWLIVILLVVCAVTQVVALQLALKCFDATFVVPVLFATYTTSSFILSLVYLDQTDTYKLHIFLLIWLSIAVLIGGVIMLSLKKQPRVRAVRSASFASVPQNPFDDDAGHGGAAGPRSKPGFARAMTGASEVDLEAAKEGGGSAVEEAAAEGVDAAPKRKKGQGWLSRFFGGSAPTPTGDAQPVEQAGASRLRVPSGNCGGGGGGGGGDHEMSQSKRRRQSGLERLDDGDSVLASERASERGAEELELDEVDGLGGYAESGSVRSERRGEGDGRTPQQPEEEDDDFGDFERATGAERVATSRRPSDR